MGLEKIVVEAETGFVQDLPVFPAGGDSGSIVAPSAGQTRTSMSFHCLLTPAALALLD